MSEQVNPPELKKASELDTNWTRGAKVLADCHPIHSNLGSEESEEKLEFAWFSVKSNMTQTPKEEQEKNDAIRQQIELGILKPNGIPVGVKDPVQPKQKISKLQRKMLRERDRAIEKDMKRVHSQEKAKEKNDPYGSLLGKINNPNIRK